MPASAPRRRPRATSRPTATASSPTRDELLEAKRAITSLLSKCRGVRASLRAKDPRRYRAQITLQTHRIDALRIAATLIDREVRRTPSGGTPR